MRLFIAINFNDNTRSQLLSLRDELQSNSKRGNFTDVKNLHLTLIFLGDCNSSEALAVKSVMDAVIFEPFDVAIDCIGRFRRDRGDLWWAGVKENKPLAELHGSLSGKLTAAGFALEKRKYSPHITLGREIATSMKPCKIEPFGETVSSIELMKSERVQGMPAYTSIHPRSAK